MNYGLRWEAQIEPSLITPINQLFYAPFIGQTVTTAAGTFTFPTNGTIPSDYKMFQPRLGIAYDMKGDGKQVLRANGGLYYARIPGLNLASVRSTDGSRGQTLFTNSSLTGSSGPTQLRRAAAVPRRRAVPAGSPRLRQGLREPADVHGDRGLRARDRLGLAASLSYTHARTDHLTRFFNAQRCRFRQWG